MISQASRSPASAIQAGQTHSRIVPPEFLLVALLLGGAAAAVALPVFNSFASLQPTFLNWPMGVLAMTVVLTGLGISLSLLACARLVVLGDPAGRMLASIFSLLVASAMVWDARGPYSSLTPAEGLTVAGAMLVGIILQVSPNAPEFFQRTRPGEEPSTVLAVRALVVVGAAGTVFNSLGMVAMASYDQTFLAYGVGGLVIGAFMVRTSAHLRNGSPSARVQITGILLANIVFILYNFNDSGASLLPAGAAIGIISLLWVPSQSRRYFGDSNDRLLPWLVLSGPASRSSQKRYPPENARHTSPADSSVIFGNVPVVEGEQPWSSELGSFIETTSFFPELHSSRRDSGRYVVSATVVGAPTAGSRNESRYLKGISTLVLSGESFVGVGVRGRSSFGALSPAERLVTWQAPLASVTGVVVGLVDGEEVLVVDLSDSSQIRLTKPRLLGVDSWRTTDPWELRSTIETAMSARIRFTPTYAEVTLRPPSTKSLIAGS